MAKIEFLEKSKYLRLKNIIESGEVIKGSVADIKCFKDFIDPLILPAVEILNAHGFETFESCQGGEGHCYPEPTVRFFGSEQDLIRAYGILECYNIALGDAKRVYRKEDVYINEGVGEINKYPIGVTWCIPFNEIVFFIHPSTGIIFLPH